MDPKDQKDFVFGRQGAGILVLARDTGRFLALKRSDHVQHGRTWGLSGGLMEAGETPAQGAEREFREETAYKGPLSTPVELTTFQSDQMTYYNFIAVVDHEFQPCLDHENEEFKWVESLDKWPEPMHFGIGFLKKDADSQRIIQEQLAALDAAQIEEARRQRQYPPTLYHVFHGAATASELQADASGEIRATPNLREALPKLIARKDRLAVAPMPGSEDFIVIIPDRENFLKNGKLDGVIFQIPGDDFKKVCAERWTKPGPLPVSDRNYFDHVQKMEAAMYYGLHMLFTPGPLTDETRAKLDEAIAAPEFPANLKQLVTDGTLIYENARRGMHVSPFLQPDDAPPPPKGPNPRSLIHFGRR